MAEAHHGLMWQLVFTAEEQPAEPVLVPSPPKPSAPKPTPKKKKPVSLTVQITPTRGELDDEDD